MWHSPKGIITSRFAFVVENYSKEMKKLVMYVYNDITTDARVQRAANALAVDFDLILISTQKGKQIEDRGYKNILVGGSSAGLRNILATIWASWRIICHEHPDLLYCHDYYSAILAYLLIRTRYSGKIIYDAHELIIPEQGHENKRLGFFYWFEKRIIKKVSMVICASKQRGSIMKEHYGLLEDPLVIPNISQLQINDEDNDVQSILESLRPFFASNKLTVVYAGAVTGSRRIDELMNATIGLSDKCKLLIVGSGSALDSLKKSAANYPELEIAFTGGIPYKCLGSVLTRCDIGFLYYPADSLNNKYCASNKIYEYASVGLPMLANENPTVKEVLEESNIGISTLDFKDGLLRLVADSKTFKHNCEVFTLNNQWNSMAIKLNETISML